MADLGIDMDMAARVAQTRYNALEWSGCKESRWRRLSDGVRDRLTREARDWLAVLRDAGIVMVEIPEPDEVDDGLAEFTDGSVAGTVHASTGVVHHGGWEWQPNQAKDVAASWLAAANWAEETREQ